ncbi:hypothetical protein PoB_003766300 [Plakobranchus ocellatus]|uniref:Uncharacterized protein n=1 Tax=Plakobranchus ocellatus TaxID=259542 RepID=A0AAV4AXC7_9GAST|nr:hypothetical protein PoB_003766300 [Plakobranchus ocellatus]
MDGTQRTYVSCSLILGRTTVRMCEVVRYALRYNLQVLVDSYDTSDILQNALTLDRSSLAFLDTADPVRGMLKTVKLTQPARFDDACVQPACVPNKEIQAGDIDFDDCRFVGYGDTSSALGGAPPQRLMEVEATVERASISKNTLVVRRKIGSEKTGPCFNDFGSPVICSLLDTKEWVTVGMTSGVALPCESGLTMNVTVENLMREAVNPDFYNSLQSFRYSIRR